MYLNGIKINNIKSLNQLPNTTKEEQNIISFLQEWFDTKTYITVNTSGSTGTPKAIQLSKKSVLKSAELTCSFFNLNEKSGLLCLPTNFIAGKLMLVRALVANMRLTFTVPSRNPLKHIENSIDFAAMTPMQVKTVLNENPNQLNLIHTLIIGGAPVDNQLRNQLKHYDTQCYATFGMTETITHIALQKINHTDYYTALPSVHFTQTEDECLVIHAPHLEQQPIITNDKIELLSPTRFTWKGRKDNVINTGGIKIQAEQLEQKIALIIPQHRFFIATEADEILGQRIILIVESSTETEINFEALNRYERPKKIYTLPQFIETETGKIQRAATQTALSADSSEES